MKRLLLALLLFPLLTVAQVSPQVYYTFDLTNPLAPYIGSTSLSTGGSYTVSNTSGIVGKYFGLKKTTSTLVNGQNVPATGSFSVEMLIKPDSLFMSNRDNLLFSYGPHSARFQYPNLSFSTVTKSGTTTTSDNQLILLSGTGAASWPYYKGWHHLVFTFNAATGAKQIFVDGLLYFTKTVSVTGSCDGGVLSFSSTTSYVRPNILFDEVALYTSVIPAAQVYSDYRNAMAGSHYTFTTYSPPVTPSTTALPDSNQFARGYVVGSLNPATITQTALTQLKDYPSPQYAPGSTNGYNFCWVDLSYLGGRYQSGVANSTAVDTAVRINDELAKDWHYYFTVNSNTNSTNYTDTINGYQAKFVAWSNRNKQYKTSAISLWNQLKPSSYGYVSTTRYINSQNLTTPSYLRDASGNFINAAGAVTTTKQIAPQYPGDSLKNDAHCIKQQFVALHSAMTDTLDQINENGEVLTFIDTVPLRKDPTFITAMTNDGYGAARNYESFQYTNWFKLLRDSIHSISGLTSTPYTVYRVDGWDGSLGYDFYNVPFAQRRVINSDYTYDQVATTQFYPQVPSLWRFFQGAANGMQSVIEGRNSELASGVPYTTPFVAAGWNVNNELNYTPAQWMGLCKLLCGTGARAFYTGYFNTASSYAPPNPPPADPKGYVWQLATPVYAQGYGSWLTMCDSLLTGNSPANYVYGNGYSYFYDCGKPYSMTFVRKKSNTAIYGIYTALQPLSNSAGNVPAMDTVTVPISTKQVNVATRNNGAMYLLDLSGTKAVCFPVDGHDQAVHPTRYDKNLWFEAEMDSLYVHNRHDVRTYPIYPSSASTFDYTSPTTAVSYVDSSTYSRDTLRWTFNLRSDTTLYVWVRCRSVNTTTAGFTIRTDNNTAYTQNLVVDSAFKYYRVAITGDTIHYRLTAGTHTLKLLATSARTEVDVVLLTPNASTSLPEGVPGTANPCTGVTASVSPAGPLTPCTSQVVTLTASSGIRYIWSSGDTTSVIHPTATGTYTCTVTNTNGCSAVSNGVIVAFSACSCTATDSTWASAIYKYSANIRWHSVSHANYYILTVTDTKTGSSTTQTWTAGTLMIAVKSLAKGRTYKALVASVCQDGSVVEGTPMYFTTLP